MSLKHDQGDRSSNVANATTVSARERYILAKLLNEHLVRSSRHLPLEQGGSTSLADGLTYASAIRVPEDGVRESDAQQDTDSAEAKASPDRSARASSTRTLPGGLNETDLNRFGASSLRVSTVLLHHTLQRC